MNELMEFLNKVDVGDDQNVKLVLERGTQVFHYTGDYLDGAFVDTNIVGKLVEFVTSDGIRENNSVMNEVSDYVSWDDEDPDYSMDQVRDHIKSDWYEFIEESLEQWDHKRGMCNLSATVTVPAGVLRESECDLDGGWTVSVDTEFGELSLEI